AIRVKFIHVDRGLKFLNDKPAGFSVAGDDAKFTAASEVKIEGGDTLLITAPPEVGKPMYVRYAWGDAPQFSLYNGADLPASPFRTGNSESRPATVPAAATAP